MTEFNASCMHTLVSLEQPTQTFGKLTLAARIFSSAQASPDK